MNRGSAIAASALAGLLVVGALIIVGAMAVWTLRGGAPSPPSAVVAREVPPTVAPVAPAYGRGSEVVQPDAAWVTATSKRTGIPEPAMRAYGRAAILAGRDLPGCRIGWNTLAGVGWNESHHGTIGGRSLGTDGRPNRRILGPVLDGSGAFAAIPATPASRQWHDNARWDRAVGPMQFISETWERWGTDADGDGVADPHDLDDAAWTAARYLCASGRDLTTGDGWRAAVLSYNRSLEYADAVFRAATTYADRVG
ncbi:lytic transglycosylase domain-containing protein [Nocardioides daejeonensis]|uniref:lytic transglycosylase domain-containing protein n=1 Tax=Nocardioides daejeonensis TaxID=1046556 RepID=UPI001EF580FF|nr:lytic murein transglycosylase [Nocardioides daejeonensis]